MNWRVHFSANSSWRDQYDHARRIWPMKDSRTPIRSLGLIQRALLNLERSVRGVVTQISPRRMFHNLRWRLSSQDFLTQWTEQRLQLGSHFWLFILGLNNSGTTLLV